MIFKDFEVMIANRTNEEIFGTAISYGVKTFYGTECWNFLQNGSMELEKILSPYILLYGFYRVVRFLETNLEDEINNKIGSGELIKAVNRDQEYWKNVDRNQDSLEIFSKKVFGFKEKHRDIFCRDLCSWFEKSDCYIELAEIYKNIWSYLGEQKWLREKENAQESNQGGERLNEVYARYDGYRQQLLNIIKGQDKAVETFLTGCMNGELQKNLRKGKGPLASFLFVGPPGVGKTFMARNVAQVLGRPFRAFDMADFTASGDNTRLIGISSHYKDSQHGELPKFLRKNPNAILLFDEIEKAHITTIHTFLPILQGGIVNDAYDNSVVDCSGTIVIFTTNAGRSLFEGGRGENLSSLAENTILSAIKSDINPVTQRAFIPPEIISRLSTGSVIPFDQLGTEKLIELVKQGFENAQEIYMRDWHLSVSWDELLVNLYLCEGEAASDARVASGRSMPFMTEIINRACQGLENLEGKRLEIQIDGNSPVLPAGAVEEEGGEHGSGESLASLLEEEITEGENRLFLFDFRRDSRADVLRDIFERAGFTCDVRYKYVEGGELEEHDFSAYKAILVNPYFAAARNLEERDENGLIPGWTTEFLQFLEEKRLECEGEFPPVYLYVAEEEIGALNIDEAYTRAFTVVDVVRRPHRAEIAGELLTTIRRSGRRSAVEKIEALLRSGQRIRYHMSPVSVSGEDENLLIVKLQDFERYYALDQETRELMVGEMERPKTKLCDVIGSEYAKEELRYIMSYMKDPVRMLNSGLPAPRGVLLYGPPGTGKTMLARAVAGETGCVFFATSGTEIISNGSNVLQKTFACARKYAPSILFIDEIDSVASERSPQRSTSYAESLLNILLTEMDGFRTPKDRPVIVIAATNLPEVIDGALMRRFDNKILVDLPDKKGRVQYARQRLANMGIEAADGVDIYEAFAAHTYGDSISRMDAYIRLAQKTAYMRGEKLTYDLLQEAVEQMRYGEKREHYDEESLKKVAIHEAGHAYMMYLYGFGPELITVTPRGNFGGYVRRKENANIRSREEWQQNIRISLAGRIAEKIYAQRETNSADEASTEWINIGAGSDLQHATDMAFAMLSEYGMEDGFLPALQREEILHSPLAEKYMTRVNEILREQMSICEREMDLEWDVVSALADVLIEKSTISGEEAKKILNRER